MFNKLKYVFAILFFCQCCVFAGYNEIYIADIQYDWIKKTEVEKEAIIAEIHDLLFTENLSKDKSFKSNYKDILKDKDWKNHYYTASAGYKEYKEYNLSAFYAGKQKHIYMYAIQNKKDLSKIYYYDALGHLKYVDLIFGEYPEYPYYSYQYKINGEPVSAIYFISKDTQYLFNPDGTFKGVWHKHNLYDQHSDIILKRTAY